jgi:succinate dehydrogenase / fumarate reductase, cytochrome b subunit
MKDKRPKHLALHQIRQPLPAIVSILHRASGALLFLSLPFLLWTFQYSLRSIETFTMLAWMFQHPVSKLVLLVILWAFFHHFCAGIRYLAIDLELIRDLAGARASSRWVIGASLILTAFAGAMLW